MLVNGNSTVLTADVQAENGVVHIIDTVLIPNHIQAAHDAWVAAGSPKAQPNLVQLVQSVPSVRLLEEEGPRLSALAAHSRPVVLAALDARDGPRRREPRQRARGPGALHRPRAEQRRASLTCWCHSDCEFTLPPLGSSQAFANLPADFLAYLLANPATALTQVLTYHVLPINLPGESAVVCT